jgi:hypothetical protein
MTTFLTTSFGPPPRGRSGGGGKVLERVLTLLTIHLISKKEKIPTIFYPWNISRSRINFTLCNTKTNSLKIPWGDLSKRQIHYTHLLRTKTLSRFSPYLGGGIVGKLTPALLPVRLTRGLGWGWAGWVLPWFPFLLTRGWGRGSGDNPYTWRLLTRPKLSALLKKKPAHKFNPNLHQIVGFSLNNPLFR